MSHDLSHCIKQALVAARSCFPDGSGDHIECSSAVRQIATLTDEDNFIDETAKAAVVGIVRKALDHLSDHGGGHFRYLEVQNLLGEIEEASVLEKA